MADPITKDAMWDQVLKRIMSSPSEFRSMNTDPNPMPIPDTSPSFVPEPAGPSLVGNTGGGGIGGFVKKHPILTALAGLGGTAIAGAAGGPKFRLGMAQGMQNIGPNIARALNTRRQTQAASEEKQAGRDTMLARLGLYKGDDEELLAVSDQARQDREQTQFKSTPEGVFRPITPEQATQNAINDIQTWMDDHPNASTQEKLAYHNQRSAQRDKEIRDKYTKIADPAGKEIIPVTGGYLDSKRMFHQTAQDKTPTNRSTRKDTAGVLRYVDDGSKVYPDEKPTKQVQAEAKAQDEAEKTAKIGESIDDITSSLNDPTSGPTIKSYMGKGAGGVRRFFSSESGAPLLPETPQEVVSFDTKMALLRDAIQRKQSGHVLNQAELELYRMITGGLAVSPETLMTKMQAVKKVHGTPAVPTKTPAKTGNIFRDKLNQASP